MSATLPSPANLDEPPSAPRSSAASRLEQLAAYRDQEGRRRAVIARPGAGRSVLVIDQDQETLTDRRLVAHLAPDEPRINAAVVAQLYLADPEGRFARALEDRDWVVLPGRDEELAGEPQHEPGELRDARGRRYHLAAVAHRHGRQTRWLRRVSGRRAQPVALRTVIGALEDYEPARAMTRAALRGPTDNVGTELLAGELRTLERSPLVLNRALREAVQRRVRSGELTLSCIAARCGRGKSALTGLRIGDTSWLGRRIGALPEAGRTEPTPWIHADVLALIARQGLGVEPREVELA
jgi:hypothetical protein